jgi:hypothetical protein
MEAQYVSPRYVSSQDFAMHTQARLKAGSWRVEPVDGRGRTLFSASQAGCLRHFMSTLFPAHHAAPPWS